MTLEGIAGSPWTHDEVEAVVAVYFQMLRLQEMGQNPSKSSYNRELQKLLPARNKSAIQRKHGNISAVLNLYGVQGLSGYKPLPNFQRLLVDVVGRKLQQDQTFNEIATRSVETPAEVPPVDDFTDFVVDPPKIRTSPNKQRTDWINATLTQRDYLEREARNRSLGLAGELLIMKYEAQRLYLSGAKALSEKIEHVSTKYGDGAGYDILSYENDGRERFIEVKTTAYTAETPFFASINEINFSNNHIDQFRLYRVFSFRKNPKVFVLSGAMSESCHLHPVSYRATMRNMGTE